MTTTSFSVLIQISGSTTIWLFEVRYIAISKSFPHHLNSFDNVPINYNGAPITILTTTGTTRSYVNTINYTTQATLAGYTHNTFS